MSPALVAISSFESPNSLEKAVMGITNGTSSFCLEAVTQMVSVNYFIPEKRKIFGFLYLNKKRVYWGIFQ